MQGRVTAGDAFCAGCLWCSATFISCIATAMAPSSVGVRLSGRASQPCQTTHFLAAASLSAPDTMFTTLRGGEGGRGRETSAIVSSAGFALGTPAAQRRIRRAAHAALDNRQHVAGVQTSGSEGASTAQRGVGGVGGVGCCCCGCGGGSSSTSQGSASSNRSSRTGAHREPRAQ